MRARRRWLIPVGLATLMVLLAAWTGWQVWRVAHDLQGANTAAHDLKTAIEDNDAARVQDAVERLQASSASARARTGGPTWSILTRAPFLGDDAAAIRTVSDSLDELSKNGAAPIASVATDLDQFLPANGRISVEALQRLQGPVAQSEAAFASADADLRQTDTSGLVSRLRDQYVDLSQQVSDASRDLSAARRALDVLPTMLGSAGPRHYLLVFQNNAEIRATGGLPGSVSLVTVDDGRISLSRQVAGNSFGRRATPVLPLTTAEKELYGTPLGTYFLDANFTPDFPRAADLMRARWEEVYGGRVDGVISLDPIAISHLLEAIGPIPVDDVTLTAENAVDQLLHEVYLRYADPSDQDAFFRDVAQAVFDRVSAGDFSSPRTVLSALTRGADERRIYVHSFDDQEQADLSGTRVAGEFVTTPTSHPQIALTLNDGTQGKMSYYLRYDVTVTPTACADNVQSFDVRARLRSTAPTDAGRTLPPFVTGDASQVKPGDQGLVVRLFGPVDGSIDRASIDEERAFLHPIDVDGRPASEAFVFLSPGETVDLAWKVRSGAGQPGSPDVFVTPSIVASPRVAPATECH